MMILMNLTKWEDYLRALEALATEYAIKPKDVFGMANAQMGGVASSSSDLGPLLLRLTQALQNASVGDKRTRTT